MTYTPGFAHHAKAVFKLYYEFRPLTHKMLPCTTPSHANIKFAFLFFCSSPDGLLNDYYELEPFHTPCTRMKFGTYETHCHGWLTITQYTHSADAKHLFKASVTFLYWPQFFAKMLKNLFRPKKRTSNSSIVSDLQNTQQFGQTPVWS